MQVVRVSAMAGAVLTLGLVGPAVEAKDKTPPSITVAFGAGMNTNIPGFTPNHHIIPQEFKVKITRAQRLNGEDVIVPATVNFVVNGFHWVWVYKDGVTLEEVQANIPAAGTFVNYEAGPAGNTNVFAKGIFPGTPPAGFTDSAKFPLAAYQNRTESIGFSVPGRYLVICNVRGHLLDGMYAWVLVVDDEDDEADD